MFKHPFEGALNSHPLKSSHGKAIRAKIVETYPRIEGHIDEIWPSKAAVLQLKIKGYAIKYLSFEITALNPNF